MENSMSKASLESFLMKLDTKYTNTSEQGYADKV